MTRPSIVLGPDEHRVSDELQLVLAGIPGIYQRGRQLIQVVHSPAPADLAAVRRVENSTTLALLARSNLRTLMTRHCCFLKPKVRNGEVVLSDEGHPVLVEAHPPEWAVSSLFEQSTWPVPILNASVEAPVIFSSGRILETPGYDRGSGLYYHPAAGLKLPPVAESPGADHVELAKTYLHEVVCNFPFEKECHRSGWYAGVLSYLARWAYSGPTPLFLVNKSAPGIGGSRLAEAAQLICAGRKGTLYTVAADNQQEKKQLDQIALNGDLLVYIDNISESTPFGTGELDKALTMDVWDCSVKYKDGTYRVPLLAIWWATGNNVQYRRGVDTFRRTQLIRLVSALERPQERTDLRHPDLLGWVIENRGQLLWSFLTLLRAYFAAGKPKHGLKIWGGFESWSDIVRECLVFHGYEDPYLAAEQLTQLSDPAQMACRRLLLGWEELCAAAGEPDGLSAHEAIGYLETELEERRAVPSKVKLHELLIAALNELAPRKGSSRLPDAPALGYLFRKYHLRVFDGRRLESDDRSTSRGRVWAVRRVTS